MQTMEPCDFKPSLPVPSATVIVARERAGALEVLMLRRAESLRFNGGMWVFPGGRVDDADFTIAGQAGVTTGLRRRWSGRFRTLQGSTLGERDTVALHLAAARETQEEAGLRLAVADLVYFSHWITPAVMAQRFDTHFFIAALPEGQSVELDERESSAHAWADLGETLGRPDIPEGLLPPTYLTLRDLAASHRRHGSLAGLLRAEATREVPPILPLAQVDGKIWDMLMPWDAEYSRAAGTAAGTSTATAAAPRRWPQHLLELPSRMIVEGRRTRLASSTVRRAQENS